MILYASTRLHVSPSQVIQLFILPIAVSGIGGLIFPPLQRWSGCSNRGAVLLSVLIGSLIPAIQCG